MGSDKYKYERIGLNGRIDTIQAAILLEKLKLFKSEIIKRNKIAENYKKIFKTLNTNIKLPKVIPKTKSTWAQFTIQLPEYCNRDEIQVKMKDKNIPTAIYYPIPIHCQIPYKNFPTSSDNLKKTNILSNNVISLPMHPYLTTKNIEYIAQSLHNILNN